MFLNKTSLVVYGICIACGIVYGALRVPFYLHFLDGLTISGFVFLTVAIVRASWIAGDFTFFSWRPRNHRKGGPDYYEEDPTHMSYREYRESIREQRKDEKNYYMPSSLLVLAIALILSLLY